MHRIPRTRATLLVVASLTPGCGETPTAPANGARLELIIQAGNNQTGVVGAELTLPLTIRAQNASGTVLKSQLVNFRVLSGGGSAYAGSAVTNNNGIARDR